MTRFLFILLTFSSFNLLAQTVQEQLYQQDSTLTYYWDNTTLEWVLTEKMEVNWEANGHTAWHYKWDATNNVWVNSSKTVFIKETFADGSYTTNSISYIYDETIPGFVNSKKDTHTKDKFGNLVFAETYLWDTGTSEWQGVYKSKQEFNERNQRTLLIMGQFWDNTTKSWAGGIRQVYTYNSSFKLIEDIHLIWDANTLSLVNETRNKYVYDLSDRLDHKITQTWDEPSNTWVDASMYTHTYNSFDSLEQTHAQTWDKTQNNWQDWHYDLYNYNVQNQLVLVTKVNNALDMGSAYKKTEFSYDQYGNLIQRLTSIINGTTWQFSSRSTNEYNASGKILGFETSTWNTSSNSWDINYKELRVYNSNDQHLSSERYAINLISNTLDGLDKFTMEYNELSLKNREYMYSWEVSISDWINNRLTEYYYSPVITSARSFPLYNHSVYPNPFNEYLSVDIKEEQTALLEIYDMNGKLVLSKSLDGFNNERIATYNLKKGIYIYHIMENERKSIGRIIKN